MLKLKILDAITHSKIYSYLLLNIFPYIRFNTYYALPDNPVLDNWGVIVKDGYKHLKKGHIILCIDRRNLAGKIIGNITADEHGLDNDNDGKADIYTHAAFCANPNHDNFEISEMTHDNYVKCCFSDICFKATRAVILECDDFDEEYVDAMVNNLPTFENAVYDVTYTMGNIKALACSALIYEIDFERRMQVSTEPLLGVKPYVSPMGLFKGKNIKIIWDSNNVVCK